MDTFRKNLQDFFIKECTVNPRLFKKSIIMGVRAYPTVNPYVTEKQYTVDPEVHNQIRRDIQRNKLKGLSNGKIRSRNKVSR
jgi:hypothetical protein